MVVLSYSFNPRENIKNHLDTSSKSLALYSSSYENLIIVDDFNVSVEEFWGFLTHLVSRFL